MEAGRQWHHGALAIVQLMHAGALSQGNRFSDTTVGPSTVQPRANKMVFYHGKDRDAVPETITEAEIPDALKRLY
ncbi:hypothetical protein [Acidisoma cladoniae]|uniref:hypothetical protein n=1 Tax=Acidisoma cladoniae TaxID=3040935 RepID=UPI00254DEAB8|nr:hypothetical protein [Acidisoma sp. PAMC 29798]